MKIHLQGSAVAATDEKVFPRKHFFQSVSSTPLAVLFYCPFLDRRRFADSVVNNVIIF
jgi:hypothetical protein